MAAAPAAKRRRLDDALSADAGAGAAVASGSAAGPAIAITVGDHAAAHPAFTHQCFEGERIVGWLRPALHIHLADPTLDAAAVAVTAGADGSADTAGADWWQSALRLALPDGVKVDVRTQVDGSEADNAAAAAAAAKAAVAAACDVRAGGNALWQPPGVLVASYTVSGGGDDRAFVVHRWQLDTPQLRSYHDAMSSLATWFIETASPIDVMDPRWTVYGAFEVLPVRAEGGEAATEASGTLPSSAGSGSSDTSGTPAPGRRYALVGYLTAYRFTNPFLRPRPCVLRLAQLLTLPWYQRQGHGARLMEALYADAARDEEVAEVSVESPCEGMARLRDAVDVAHACRAGAFADLLGAMDERAEEPPAVTPLSPEEAAALRASLRITLGQVHRVHEALLLARWERWRAAAIADGRLSADGEAAAAKPLRLLVKKRIFAMNEDIAAVSDVDYRKRVLENEYVQAAAAYAAALAKNGLLLRMGGGVGAGDGAAAARVAELAAVAAASQAAMDAEVVDADEGEESS